MSKCKMCFGLTVKEGACYPHGYDPLQLCEPLFVVVYGRYNEGCCHGVAPKTV